MSTYYNSSITSGEVAGIFAGIFAVIGVICFIAFVVGIFHIIGMWKILKKAGKPGWGSLIPFYNVYLLCQITGINPWWILIVIFSPILCIVPIIGSLASMAVSIYFSILLNVSLARSFGKEDAYAVGLILLAPFFYFALGIGNDEYKGENPMEDFIFKDNNSNTSNPATSSNSKTRYCSGCGTKIDDTTKFCPKCGQEVK